jgi:putative tryptophan/tyrosine transport system substrate-binding protein
VRRRAFIAALGGAAVWPVVARAQQPMTSIGFLNPTSPESNGDRLRGFRQGIGGAGYIEGENAIIDYRWAEGQNDRLPQLAAALVRHHVSVMAAFTPAAASAAKAATTTIPIVFGVNEDPVKLGLVANLARPDGNATGVNFFTAEVAAKRLDLLHELLPEAARIAVLVNPANDTSTDSTLRDAREAARAIGLQIQILNARTSDEINTVFEAIGHERPDALFVA